MDGSGVATDWMACLGEYSLEHMPLYLDELTTAGQIVVVTNHSVLPIHLPADRPLELLDINRCIRRNLYISVLSTTPTISPPSHKLAH